MADEHRCGHCGNDASVCVALDGTTTCTDLAECDRVARAKVRKANDIKPYVGVEAALHWVADDLEAAHGRLECCAMSLLSFNDGLAAQFSGSLTSIEQVLEGFASQLRAMAGDIAAGETTLRAKGVQDGQ